MVASMVKGWFSLSTPESLKKITSSTHSGVDKKYIHSTPDVTGDIGL
jgi:hypothetical protein